MGLGRRKVRVHDPKGWVFNRMAEAYRARPAYPEGLLDALATLAPPGGQVADVGAGIGHLALPLAERGLAVSAVEPASAMLDHLRRAAARRALPVYAIQAAAEATGLPPASSDLVVIADALHFLDAERTGREVARVLRRGGALALITCELADTRYMRALSAVMREAAPRRRRDVSRLAQQLVAVARLSRRETHTFEAETPVTPAILEQILRSISFIGPAMHAARFDAFRARIHAVEGPPVWSRKIILDVYRAQAACCPT